MVTNKPKATPHERQVARYEKLCVTIERWQRRLDKADRTVQRAVRMITKLERQRKRAKAKLDGAEVAAANSAVESVAVPVVTPKPKRKRRTPEDVRRELDSRRPLAPSARADLDEVRRQVDAAIDSTIGEPPPKRPTRKTSKPGASGEVPIL